MVDRIEYPGQPAPAEAPPVEDKAPAIPQKFQNEDGSLNQEAMLRSYSELESKVGLPSDAPKPAKEADTNDAGAAEDSGSEADTEADKSAEAAVAAGVDMAALEEEFAKEGKLSDESYADLEAKGFSRAEADEYIEFRTQKAERYSAELYAEVGGEEQFASMADWARENWSEEELKEYNAAIDSQDGGRAKIALKALRAGYEKVKGKSPTLLTPSAGTVRGGSVYRSDAEMITDMQDPKYKSDPAFRQDVLDKVARSQRLYGQA